MDGILITFEAGEGVKKMPFLMAAAEFLIKGGIPVVCTREPGSERGAEAFRLMLEDRGNRSEAAMAELIYLTSARLEHVNRVIKPALDAGFVVLCDRFVHSTLAYQGAGGVPETLIRSLHEQTTNDLWPDLTFYFDLPVEETLTRLSQKIDSGIFNKFESRGEGFHRSVRDTFIRLCEDEPENMIMIAACRDTPAIEVDLIHHLSRWFRHE